MSRTSNSSSRTPRTLLLSLAAVTVAAAPSSASADLSVTGSTAIDYGYVAGESGPDINGNTSFTLGTSQAGVAGPYSAAAASGTISYGSGASSASVALNAYALAYDAGSITAAGGYTTTQNEVYGGPGTPYVDGPYATVASTVNFTVSQPTYYTITGTLPGSAQGAATSPGFDLLLNGATEIYNFPGQPSQPTNVLLPGNTYTLDVGFKSTAYQPDPFPESWNFKLNATAITPGSSAPATTATASVYGGYVNGNTGTVAAAFTGAPNGTLTVASDQYISAEGFSGASSPLGEQAGPVTFALPNANGATEGWDVSFTADGQPLTGPTTLTFSYDPSLVGAGVNPASLAIYHYTGGQWVLPAGEVVDAADDTITVEVDSFSPFALGLAAVPEPSSMSLAALGVAALLAKRRRLSHQ